MAIGKRIMGFINSLPPYLLSLAAAVALGLSLYFCWREKLPAAGLAAGLFFLCVILAYLPQLESVQAFAINVKLRSNIARAEEVLARIKELAIVNSRVSYMTIAWGNRMGSPLARDKQEILDEIDDQLRALKVSDDERQAIVRPYVQLIGVDLFQIFSRTIERYVQWKRDELTRRFDQSQDKSIQEQLQKFIFDEAEWRKSSRHGPYENLKSYDLDTYLRASIPTALFDTQERDKVGKFRGEVLTLYNASKTKGGLTSEAADFEDKYRDLGGYDAKMKEIFGVSLNDLN